MSTIDSNADIVFYQSHSDWSAVYINGEVDHNLVGHTSDVADRLLDRIAPGIVIEHGDEFMESDRRSVVTTLAEIQRRADNAARREAAAQELEAQAAAIRAGEIEVPS